MNFSFHSVGDCHLPMGILKQDYKGHCTSKFFNSTHSVKHMLDWLINQQNNGGLNVLNFDSWPIFSVSY